MSLLAVHKGRTASNDWVQEPKGKRIFKRLDYLSANERRGASPLTSLRDMQSLVSPDKGVRYLRPKLRVSQPTDIYEQEAAEAAEQVMKMPSLLSNSLRQSQTGSKEKKTQGKCPSCELNKEREDNRHKETSISRRSFSYTTGLESADGISDIRGGGSRLDDSTREFMESRLGYDFSGVRIHTDERAARSARSINALAYTVKNDIVFGEGQYRPNTPEGKKLLAHELTHVLQHNGYTQGSIVLRNASGQRMVSRNGDSTKKGGTKDVKTQFNELVAAGKFDDAIQLIIRTYNLPTKNLEKISYDASLTSADAVTTGTIGKDKPQTVKVGPSTFKESFAHSVKIIGHELQHVQQRSGDKPIMNQDVREFLAFAWEALDTTTPALTDAERMSHAKLALKYYDKFSDDEKKAHEQTQQRLKKLIEAKGKGNP